MRYGIFTNKRHATKLINYINICSDIGYIISTDKYGPRELQYDIGICYCFQHLIDEESLKEHVCYNYHPAPLSNKGSTSYGDWGNYARGLKDIADGKLHNWGVSLHLIEKNIDRGAVLTVLNFPLRSIPVDISELGDISHYFLFQLFKETIDLLQFKPKTEEEFKKLE
jgi:methionyl-tRNA formyltransferase